MTALPIDPECLAAVIDGSATAEERAAVLRVVARSQTAYRQFVEASAIVAVLADSLATADLRALPAMPPAASEAPSSGLPLHRRSEVPVDTANARRSAFRIVVPVLVAAAAITVVVLTRRSPTSVPDLQLLAQSTRIRSAAGSGSLARTLGPTWSDARWSVPRGSVLLQAHASRAFRFGVRLAQLEVAMNAHDTASVSRATLQLQQLLHDVQGSAPLSSRLEAMGRQFDFGTASERRVLWSQLRTMLGAGEWFDLGSWSGAAQLAALNGQQAYFASDGQALHALTSVLASPAVPADAWDAVTRPLHSLQHGTEPDASQVRDIATMLAGVFASAGG